MAHFLHALAMILMTVSTLTHAAAGSQSALVVSSAQPVTSYDFIGLSVSPRGNHVMHTHESSENELSIIFVYSEDPDLKEGTVLAEIAKLFFSAGRQAFCAKLFKQVIDQYLTKKMIIPEEARSCDPVLCIENLIAFYIQLSRTSAALQKSYEIQTEGFAYHEGGITPCDRSVIGYSPYDDNLWEYVNPFAPAQRIADRLQKFKPHLPFHLILDCRKLDFPPDSTKEFVSAEWCKISIFPEIDTISYISTVIKSKTRYKERSDSESDYARLMRKFYEEEKQKTITYHS